MTMGVIKPPNRLWCYLAVDIIVMGSFQPLTKPMTTAPRAEPKAKEME